MGDLISIIVPVYNTEEYLNECLETLVNQTYNNIEIILIDDGSTDNSGNICDSWSQRDNRVRVYHRSNSGAAASRNYGIKNSKGNYIAFVDSDDWTTTTLIERLYGQIAKYNADCSCCGLSLVKKGKNIKTIVPSKENVYCAETIIKKLIIREEIGIGPYCKLFSKHIFDNIKFPEGQTYEDVAIMYKLFDKCEKICTVPSVEYFYRQIPTSITKSGCSVKKYIILDVDRENEKFLIEKYDNINRLILADTAKNCINSMISIVKCKDGYEIHKKQYNLLRNNLLKRLWAYFSIRKNIQFKRVAICLFVLCENTVIDYLYKKMVIKSKKIKGTVQ